MSDTSEDNCTTPSVEGILDELEGAAQGQDSVNIATIVEAVGHRGYGPFLTVPALLELSPIGAVPGVPTVLALIISTFALQIALGRHNMWLPDFIERWSVSAGKVQKAVEKLRPAGKKMDHWFHGRLPVFANNVAIRAAAVAAIALCMTVPPLEVVPFASSVPMAAIAILGVAILVRDGALMLAGYTAALIAVATGYGMFGP